MRSVIVAFGSFMVGALCMFLMLSGHHTSTIVQPLLAQGVDFGFSAAIPVVPALTGEVKNNDFDGTTILLDGLNCTQCVFRNVTFEYSGGAYRLSDISFAGRIQISLRGAASNTLAALHFFNIVSPAIPQKPPNPPIFRDFDDRLIPITLISPAVSHQ